MVMAASSTVGVVKFGAVWLLVVGICRIRLAQQGPKPRGAVLANDNKATSSIAIFKHVSWNRTCPESL